MKRSRTSYPIRRVFLLDELSIILSLFLAYLVRHYYRLGEFFTLIGGLYRTLLATLFLICIVVFLLYDYRKPSIFEMDPFENLVSVTKSRIIAVALTIAYLYIVQRSKQASRTILILLLFFSIVLGYAFRMLFRQYGKKRYFASEKINTLKITAPFAADEDIEKMLNEGSYDEALIIGSDTDPEGAERVIRLLESKKVRTYLGLSALGYNVKSGIVTDIKRHATIPVSVRFEKFPLFGVDYSIARTEEAVLHVIRHIKELSGQYICFSNVHTSVMARENREYADVLNSSAFTFPDGNPIAQLQRKRGVIGAERVAGPDFMEHMFRDTQDGRISHFFYGASQETLDALKERLEKKYPGIVIKGLYSPPFRALSDEEDAADVDMINDSGADIVWIGLGAPKQEKWMQAHKGRIKGVMMGVGAGFDFHAGTIKRAPKWIQKVGLEWLYRLFQDPGRLIKRYLVTNIKFLWYLGVDLIFKKRV